MPKFLPINIDSDSEDVFRVVLVDDQDFEAHRGKPWKLQPGQTLVNRRGYNRISSKLEGHTVVSTYWLAKEILNLPPQSQVIFLNGDLLDYRRENLLSVDRGDPRRTSTGKGGEVVSTFPGYSFACNDVITRRSELVDEIHRGTYRKQYKQEQVSEMLRYIVKNNLQGLKLSEMFFELMPHFPELLADTLSMSLFSQIIKGNRYHDKDFDYSKIVYYRPRRTKSQTEERWLREQQLKEEATAQGVPIQRVRQQTDALAYRLLAPGEFVEQNDQYFHKASGRWFKVSHYDRRKENPLSAEEALTYRRLKEVSSDPQSSNGNKNVQS